MVKLQEHIKQLKDNGHKQIGLKDIPYAASLLQYITDALNLTDTQSDAINSFKKIIINIESILLNQKITVSMKILLERAKLLIIAKYNIIKGILKTTEKLKGRQTCNAGQVNLTIEEIRTNIEKSIKENQDLEIEMSMWKRKAKSFQKMKGVSSPEGSHKSDNFYTEADFDTIEAYQLDDLNSEFDNRSSYSGLSDYSSNSASSLMKPNGEATENKLKKIDQATKNLGSYKNFVRLVLRTKFEVLEPKAPGQSVSEKALWTEANKQSIDIKSWESFIIGELKNPTKYLEAALKKRASKNFIPTLDTIYEEV